jgi:hypothetical protein
VSLLGWILTGWLVVSVVVVVMLDRATRHAPLDPSEVSEDFVPESWSWPAREPDDVSTVRHGGLGR